MIEGGVVIALKRETGVRTFSSFCDGDRRESQNIDNDLFAG